MSRSLLIIIGVGVAIFVLIIACGLIYNIILRPPPLPTAIPTSLTQSILAPTNPVLTLSIRPDPTIYSQAGQQITYNYTITNSGPATLPPAQFFVNDTHFPNPIVCGPNNTTLANGQSVPCSAVYTTTPADAGAPQIVSSATASGGGASTAQPATATVIRSNVTLTVPVNITPGTNVTHVVTPGDWMLQISRCYGANFNALWKANPSVKNPNVIFPNEVVLVPNVGSNGPIYGPPCMVLYTVVSGDTWRSIANKYNANIEVLRAANEGITLSPGVKVKVPVNSNTPGATQFPLAPTQTTPIPPTPITPTPFTPIPSIIAPIPLTFPAGNPTSVTQSGNIGTPGTIRYVFSGLTGQTLTVQLGVPSNDVMLGITAPNNSILKSLNMTNSWNGSLPMNGNYFIDLVSQTGAPSKPFTLQVTLNTPATALPPTTPPPPSSVVRVADIYPGPNSSNPSYLSTYNAQLYFQADGNNGAGAELWRYDVGQNATAMVANIYPGAPGSEPNYLRPYQSNMLYFGANGNDNAGKELWRFNGSAVGRVYDIFPGAEGSFPSYMTEFNGDLYFSANGNNGAGVELWKFNFTTSSASMADDINEGSGSSNPSYLAVYNGALYFAATTSNGGTELWKYDGTNATLASDINPGVNNSNPAFLAVYNGFLYFSANGNNGAGVELWKFDGTNASMADDINPGPADSAPTYLTVFNTNLCFGAVGNSNGFELWRFNGTDASMVADIYPGPGSSNPGYLAVYSNQLYFQANANDGAGIELWKFIGP